MPYSRQVGAGTVVLKAGPGVLNRINVINSTFGLVSIHDVAAAGSVNGTATLVYSWTPAALGEQRELDIPCGIGITAVLNAATLIAATYDMKTQR